MAGNTVVGRISIRVNPDTSKFRERLRQQLREIERSIEGDVPIDIRLNTRMARAQMRALMADLRALGRQGVDIRTRVQGPRPDDDTFGGEGGGGGSGGRRNGGLKGLIPSFGSGMNAPAMILALTASLWALAPIVGIVTSALLALPGAITTVLVPVAALALGMDGIKEAAKPVGKALDDIKTRLSAKAKDQFTPSMQRLADVLPKITTRMPMVTQGLSDMMDGFTAAISTDEGMGKINNIVGNIGTALSKAAPGVSSFTSGLLSLAEVFSGKLGKVAEWFNDAGNKFDIWVTKLKGDGTLSTMFDGLGSTLKTILEIIVELGKKGIEFMKDPESLKSFINDIKALGQALAGIVAVSASFVKGVSAIKNVIGGKDANTGEEGGLGTKIGGAAVAGLLGGPLGIIMNQGGPGAVFEKLRAGSDAAAAAVKQSWIDVSTVVSTGFTTVNERISSAFTGANEAVSNAFSSIKSSVTDAMSQVGSAISEGAGRARQILSEGFSSAKNAVIDAFQGMRTAASEGIGSLISEVGQLPGKILGILGNLGGTLVAAGRALMEGLLNGIRAGAEAVYNYVSGIASKIAALKGPLPYDRKVLIPNGQALMEGLGTGIDKGMDPVLVKAKAIAQKIADAVASGGSAANIGNEVGKDSMVSSAKALDEESKRLDSQMKALDYKQKSAGNEALKGRIEELKKQKEQIDAQKEMVGLAGDYGKETEKASGGEDPLVKAASGAMNLPVDFAKATGKQFLSDIGISGNGLIPNLLTEGMQYIFNVGSVDEALSAKSVLQNKQALQFTGR